ncbi:hypothetical protein JYT51_00555 [Candidatus Amoebophilus asiaticus]|nr:hypothetical protein [Candidatus Amoebophilus asiaticus]
MKFKSHHIVCVVSLALIFQNCSKKCEVWSSPDNYRNIYLHFYSRVDSSYIDTLIFARVYGEGSGTDLVGDDNYYGLPINLHLDSMTYIFSKSNTFDSLVFKYNRELEFISEECGYGIKITDLEIKSTSFTDISRLYRAGYDWGLSIYL